MKTDPVKVIACQVLWREFSYYAALSQRVFHLEFLKQGLHNTPDRLRDEVQAAIDKCDREFDAILVGYGLCSNGIQGIKARDTRLVIPRAHDCITLLLGSKERYREYFDSHPGTYWYSPGWIDTNTQPGEDRYQRTFQAYVEKYGEDNAKYLMVAEQGWLKEYSNAAYVDLGFGNNQVFKDYTKQCAKSMNWNYDELAGDASLLTNLLEGNWTEEDFLVVEPGQQVEASHDNGILRIAKAGDSA